MNGSLTTRLPCVCSSITLSSPSRTGRPSTSTSPGSTGRLTLWISLTESNASFWRRRQSCLQLATTTSSL
jgi:hypothetical protein